MAEICKEMIQLRKYLDLNKIKWKDKSEDLETNTEDLNLYICRTHFWYKNNFYSAINGFGTYGGYFSNEFYNKNQGLIELMSSQINGGEPVGFLTAEDCIKLILYGE